MRALLLTVALFTSPSFGAKLVYEKSLSANAVAVDAAGNAYLANSGTVTKLNPDGTVSYSKTVSLGGNWTGIAVDGAGDVVIAGTISDDTLPTSGVAAK
jgi:hypothetical protein